MTAAIETMNGSRSVDDQLELCGWNVMIADAQKVKGLAPLACKTDRIDAHVLAELSRRDLVPEVWLPATASHTIRRTVSGGDGLGVLADRVEHEPRQVIWRRPLAQTRRQQQLLLTITRDEVLAHHRIVLTAPDRAPYFVRQPLVKAAVAAF